MITVSVRGADRVAHGLRTLAARLRDLSPAWRRIDAQVIGKAKPLTPVLTGRLVASLKARVRTTDVVISAGGGSIAYAGVQNYGWAARNIRARHFLEGGPAQEYVEQEAAREVESVLAATARLAGIAA